MPILDGSSYTSFVIRLSQPATEPVDVSWRTQSVTALPGQDYAEASGTVTFLPTETEKTIQVLVYGRAQGDNEPRRFDILLLPAPNVVLGSSTSNCIITVVNEDDVVVSTVTVASGQEGLSAYEVAKLQGFQGTAAEWQTYLRSPAVTAAAAADLVRQQTENVRTETLAVKNQAQTVVDAAPALLAARDQAQLAATTASVDGKLYTTVVAGNGAAIEGGYYWVKSASPKRIADLYQKVAGAPVPQIDTNGDPVSLPSASLVFAQAAVATDDGHGGGPNGDTIGSITDATGVKLISFLRDGGFRTAFITIDSSTGVLKVVDPDGLVIFKVDPIGGVLFQQKDFQPVYVPPEPTILLGPKLWVGQGQSVSLYADHIFPDRANVEDITLSLAVTPTLDSAAPLSFTGRRSITVPASALNGTTAELIARSTVERMDVMSRRAMTIDNGPINGAGKTVRILPIGDSITNRNLLRYIDAILVGWGFTVIWLGTVPSSNTGNRFDATGPLSEAREALGYADYTYSVLDGESAPIADTPEARAAYLQMAKDENGKWKYIPFLRLATGADPVGKVKNGYVFDVPRYRDNYGIATPTHVIEGLGKNDLLEDPAGAAARIVEGINIILPSVRAAWAPTRIGKWFPPTPRTVQADKEWRDYVAPAHRAAIKAVQDLAATDPLIDFINVHATVDTAALWPLATRSTDPTGSQSVNIGDIVHPGATNNFGRRALAVPLATWIARTAA